MLSNLPAVSQLRRARVKPGAESMGTKPLPSCCLFVHARSIYLLSTFYGLRTCLIQFGLTLDNPSLCEEKRKGTEEEGGRKRWVQRIAYLFLWLNLEETTFFFFLLPLSELLESLYLLSVWTWENIKLIFSLFPELSESQSIWFRLNPLTEAL